MLTEAMGQEVRYSRVPQRPVPQRPRERLARRTDLHPGGAGPGRRSAATEPGIGTVTVSGVGFSHDDVAVWLESLAGQKGYANPYFSSSTESLIGDAHGRRLHVDRDADPRRAVRRYTTRPEADMDKLKQWVALTVVGALAILAAGWFLLVSPKRAEAAELRAAGRDAGRRQRHARDAARGAQGAGQGAAEGAGRRWPTSPRRSRTTRRCRRWSAPSSTASTTAGVELVSVTPGAAAVARRRPAAAAAPRPAAASRSGGAAPPRPQRPRQPPAGQLASIPVAINVVGDYFEVRAFLAALEALPRALRVNDLTLAPACRRPRRRRTSAVRRRTDGSSLTTHHQRLRLHGRRHRPAAPPRG